MAALFKAHLQVHHRLTFLTPAENRHFEEPNTPTTLQSPQQRGQSCDVASCKRLGFQTCFSKTSQISTTITYALFSLHSINNAEVTLMLPFLKLPFVPFGMPCRSFPTIPHKLVS